MKRLVLLGVLSIGWPALAHADIYKCVDSYGIIYQSRPCAADQVQTLISASKSTPPAAPALAQSTPAPVQSAPVFPYRRDVAFHRTTLEVGMSDDEVLNLPGYGVPKRIERFRNGRVYREEWIYELHAGGARRLHFANAKLTGMELEQPADQIVSLSVR